MAEPIMLVLGAGASYPLGYPLGSKLRELLTNTAAIPDKLFAPYDERRDARNWHHHQEAVDEKTWSSFATVFRDSTSESIDRFLAHRKDFAEIGKRAIASVILSHESDAVADRTVCSDWMSWLLNKLTSMSTNVKDWPIEIVTFNYDRSFGISE